MKLVIAQSQSVQGFADQSVFISADSQNLSQLLQVFAANSFDVIESTDALGQSVNLLDKELWRLLFSALKQNGDISLNVNLDQNLMNGIQGGGVSPHDALSSLLKMNGFTNIHITDKIIQGKKPQWQASGAPLKRREKQADQIQQNTQQFQQVQVTSNPWAALQQQDGVGLINEDELMKDVSGSDATNNSVFQKFCGEDDKIMAGKPCENCTCGKKELQEGKITVKDLEVGNVQSDCGKCYLGDAFRCASCPYLGQPAFEAGDKVKLKNSANAQVNVESEFVPIKAAEILLRIFLQVSAKGRQWVSTSQRTIFNQHFVSVDSLCIMKLSYPLNFRQTGERFVMSGLKQQQREVSVLKSSMFLFIKKIMSQNNKCIINTLLSNQSFKPTHFSMRCLSLEPYLQTLVIKYENLRKYIILRQGRKVLCEQFQKEGNRSFFILKSNRANTSALIIVKQFTQLFHPTQLNKSLFLAYLVQREEDCIVTHNSELHREDVTLL
eukprot:403354085